MIKIINIPSHFNTEAGSVARWQMLVKLPRLLAERPSELHLLICILISLHFNFSTWQRVWKRNAKEPTRVFNICSWGSIYGIRHRITDEDKSHRKKERNLRCRSADQHSWLSVIKASIRKRKSYSDLINCASWNTYAVGWSKLDTEKHQTEATANRLNSSREESTTRNNKFLKVSFHNNLRHSS